MISLDSFTHSFIPLFIAIDAIGILPIFLSLTHGLKIEQRKHLTTQAVLTAAGISVAFLFVGKLVFRMMNITEGDFRIAGGVVLLIVAISDLAFGTMRRRRGDEGDVGIVPIGIPLVMGPAALTTILISIESHGILATLTSLSVNLLLVWLLFRKSHWALRLIGQGGARAVGKVMQLFMAAIAVMMIRVGLTSLLSH